MKRKQAKHFFPFRLRHLRESMLWSQSDLAKRAGFQPSAISHFERGRREPSLTNFIRLADALGCDLEDLAWGNMDDEGGAK